MFSKSYDYKCLNVFSLNGHRKQVCIYDFCDSRSSPTNNPSLFFAVGYGSLFASLNALLHFVHECSILSSHLYHSRIS